MTAGSLKPGQRNCGSGGGLGPDQLRPQNFDLLLQDAGVEAGPGGDEYRGDEPEGSKGELAAPGSLRHWRFGLHRCSC